MAPEVHELSVWQNPPKFKHHLLLNLVCSFCCSTLLFLVGTSLILDPYMALRETTRELVDDHVHACQSDFIDLCPISNKADLYTTNINGWLLHMAWFVVATGSIDLIICLMAGVGMQTMWKPALFVSVGLIPFAVGMEWKLVDLAVHIKTPYHEWGKDQMLDSFRNSYMIGSEDSNEFTRLFNTIMILHECCGIRHPNDSIFISEMIYEYPPACCITNLGSMDGLQVESTTDGQCQSNTTTWRIHSMGCFEKVHRDLYKKHGKLFVCLLLVLIALQSGQTIFSVFVLLRRKEQKKKPRRRQALRESEKRPDPNNPNKVIRPNNSTNLQGSSCID